MIVFHPAMDPVFVEYVRETVAAWSPRGDRFLRIPLKPEQVSQQAAIDEATADALVRVAVVKRTPFALLDAEDRRGWMIEFGDPLSAQEVAAWVEDNWPVLRRTLHERVERMDPEARHGKR